MQQSPSGSALLDSERERLFLISFERNGKIFSAVLGMMQDDDFWFSFLLIDYDCALIVFKHLLSDSKRTEGRSTFCGCSCPINLYRFVWKEFPQSVLQPNKELKGIASLFSFSKKPRWRSSSNLFGLLRIQIYSCLGLTSFQESWNTVVNRDNFQQNSWKIPHRRVSWLFWKTTSLKMNLDISRIPKTFKYKGMLFKLHDEGHFQKGYFPANPVSIAL